ncbi:MULTISPECIES: hypothetical protein [Streptomyces]|jgi:hypothetical protein|uniref:hypothetical protein n=1 Tax=Streptomyces TaxID=1883 RepID=UPI001672120D|nr:hypothetical protein [Streptomyces umbrinus]MCR3725785.1 hypothetical protein [Streptomyces umbrinus]GHB18260.1 hypothetical protein GCM10010306_008150 [Streptomyces umbrinus]GHH49238.1 hypothetical protein GCM10018775_44590 [Streptomyces umbrinus]
MARFPAYQNPTARRALLALTTAGIAVGVGATSAAADTEPVVDVVRTRPTSLGNVNPQAGVQALTGTVGYVTGPVAGLKPNPLAGTGVDPLDNGLATQVADFPPLATTMLTAPVAQAQSLGAVPVLGQVTGLLH